MRFGQTHSDGIKKEKEGDMQTLVYISLFLLLLRDKRSKEASPFLKTSWLLFVFVLLVIEGDEGKNGRIEDARIDDEKVNVDKRMQEKRDEGERKGKACGGGILDGDAHAFHTVEGVEKSAEDTACGEHLYPRVMVKVGEHVEGPVVLIAVIKPRAEDGRGEKAADARPPYFKASVIAEAERERVCNEAEKISSEKKKHTCEKCDEDEKRRKGASAALWLGKGEGERQKEDKGGDEEGGARHREEGSYINKDTEKKPNSAVFFLGGEVEGGGDQHRGHRACRCPRAPSDKDRIFERAAVFENDARRVKMAKLKGDENAGYDEYFHKVACRFFGVAQIIGKKQEENEKGKRKKKTEKKVSEGIFFKVETV